MSTDYSKRLRIGVLGNPRQKFFSPSGIHIATGYTRVVIGERGPYVEFIFDNLEFDSITVKSGEEWRQQSDRAMYGWYECGDVKLYNQRRTVDYADYRIGRWYASPFSMVDETNEPFIYPLRRKKDESGS